MAAVAHSELIRAGIVVTGTEVITATIRDENGPWLSERLGGLGVEVAHICVVADRRGDLEDSLAFLDRAGVDLIITSGGLGPTADDLTAEVVADFCGLEMELDPEMEAKIAGILERFAKRVPGGLDRSALDQANRKQAMVPRGAEALDPVGTAPGLVVPHPQGPLVLVLPGPPGELRPMWDSAVETAPMRELLERASPLSSYRLRMFGIPESEIALSLREIEKQGVDLEALEITTCLRRGEIEIDVRYRDGAEPAAEDLRRALALRHEHSLFSDDGRTIDEIVAGLLGGHVLGLAESCTGGMLATRLTSMPGSSEYFAGSAVTYSDAAKRDLLGVDPELLEAHGAVSPEVAEAMARGALERFGADLAVSITGVAGPGGGSEEKPVGYVCLHLLAADGSHIARDPVIPGRRADIRERSGLVAMHMLRRMLS